MIYPYLNLIYTAKVIKPLLITFIDFKVYLLNMGYQVLRLDPIRAIQNLS